MPPEPRSRPLLPQAPAAAYAGALALAFGALVLLGWTLDIAALQSLLPGWGTVLPTTALAFVLTGIGLLLASQESSATRSWASGLCLLLAALVGLFTPWDSASCFVLVAAAWGISRGAGWSPRVAIASVVLAAAATGVASLALFSFTPMAVPTSIVFVVVGGAVVLDSWRNITEGKGHTPFSVHLQRMGLSVCSLAIAFALYARSEREILRTHQLRLESFLLADELRQSGDDLTRMARTYVVTGDPAYKQSFQNILDIRDGKKPRPKDYWRPYWDLWLKGGTAPRGSEEAVPLLEMMKRAGFSGIEFQRLAEAKASSDGLTRPEFEAMALVESSGPDVEANRSRARLMLYDEAYHQAKAAVMGPIHDFLRLVDERTLTTVRGAELTATITRCLFAAAGLLLMFGLWRTYLALGNTLGGTVDEVYGRIAAIGSGDVSGAIPVKAGQKDSVLGWLSETQARLNDLDRDRRQTEEARSRLAAIVESSADAIVGITLDGVVTSWNVGAERLFGYSAEEMIGQPITRLVPPDRLGEEMHLLREIGRGEQVTHYETVRRHKDGAILDLSLTISPVRDGAGRIIGASKIARDIGEVTRAQTALRHREQELRLIMDAAPALISYIDDHYCYRRVNASYERWFGLSAEQVQGQHIREVLGDAAWDAARPYMERAISGEAVTYQRSLPYRHGGQRWVHVTYRPDRDAAGRVHGFVAYVVDISELKQAEEALRDSEQRFRATFEQAAFGFTLVSPEGRFEQVNEALCKMVGYSREELTRLTFQDITYPEDLGIDLALVGQVLSGEIPTYTLEKRYICKDRSVIWINLTVSLVRRASGEPAYFIAGIENISRRKHAEAELRQLNATLEQRIAERTAQLEASNKELEAFSYSVSHDLRAPLRGIDGWSHALVEDYGDRLDDQGREYVTRVCAEAQRMGRLIDDLLELSRLNRTELRRESVDLSALAGEIFALLRRREPERKVETIVAPGMTAWGDPGLLRVALENLLGNAWKFTGKKPEATIECGAVPAAGTAVTERGSTVYFVRDNGVGFDMAHATKLFSPFQRLHRPSEFPGTGIGLATVQRILRRHGGRAWAEGEPDRGATFYFSLPREEYPRD